MEEGDAYPPLQMWRAIFLSPSFGRGWGGVVESTHAKSPCCAEPAPYRALERFSCHDRAGLCPDALRHPARVGADRSPPGILVSLHINVQTIIPLLVAGLMAAGTNWLLSDHPA